MTDETLNLYARARTVWGSRLQIDMAIEECAELIVALQHAKRSRPADIEDEIADVMIMCEQLSLIFDTTTVSSSRQRKLARLEERVSLAERLDLSITQRASMVRDKSK